VEAGRAGAEVMQRREQGDGQLLCWEEVEALSRTGVFEFQSHTHLHARIPVAPRLDGFLHPAVRQGYAALEVPLIGEDGRDLLAHEVRLGTPLLRSAPRTSDALRFHEDPSIRVRCVQAVEAEGGETFFSRPGWQRELSRLVPAEIRGRLETTEEREQAIRTELEDARGAIEERLGRPAELLCYPWHAFGPTARRLAAEVGYRLAFCGKVDGTPITRPGGDLMAVARIGEDYLELLPGRGRRRLSSVLSAKWRRRLGRGT
jgi:hypothetical protein